MNENPFSDPLKRLSDEISLNLEQIKANKEIASQSAQIWVIEKTNLFLTKVDEGFDRVIVSILGSITNDPK